MKRQGKSSETRKSYISYNMKFIDHFNKGGSRSYKDIIINDI